MTGPTRKYSSYLRLASIACALAATAAYQPAHCWDGAQMAELQRLEQQVLGQNNFDMALDQRLSLVEGKVLGGSRSGSLKKRLLDIERKLNPSAYPEEPSETTSVGDKAAPEESIKKPRIKERGLQAEERQSAPSKVRTPVPPDAGRRSAGVAAGATTGATTGGGLSVDASAVTSKPMFDPPLSQP
jgi:hypothetical protein